MATTRLRTSIASLVILTGLLACPAWGQHAAPLEPAAPPTAPAPPSAKYAPDRVLVRFKSGVTKRAMEGAHLAFGVQALKSYRSVERLQVVQLPHGMPVEEALAAYRANPDVLYAEPDYLLHIDLTPNDPCFTGNAGGVCPTSRDMWGLHNVGTFGGTPDADIDAPEAWNLSTGNASVVVVVIDTGIDYTHPDLAPNMIQLESDCADGVDNDGNGFTDDCRGIDTFNGDTNPFDDHSHGTHVAGTIGARGNNSVGVVGVNWNVTLMACKFISAANFGTTSGAIGCLDYVALMKDRGLNIVATNNSWGGDSFSQALEDAIDAQRSRGILFVASAGNNGMSNDAVPAYPANYFLPNLLAVAATTRQDLRSSFTNIGRRTVHLGAPGSTVLSSIPGSAYAFFSGTSMAAPHVTGSIALLKAQDSSRDWRALRNLVLTGGDDTFDLSASTVTGKRLNVFGAMTCSNSSVQRRLRPTSETLHNGVGIPVALAYLNINCAAPAGSVQASVNPGGQLITLVDDGVVPDRAVGDGIYTADWVSLAAQTTALTFPGNDVVTVKFPAPYQVTPASFSYRDISATGTNLSFGDESTNFIHPLFALQFGGLSFTTIFVSSNGTLNFDDQRLGDFENPAIPTLGFGTIVAPWWDDLTPVPGSARNVFFGVLGSPPNREFVVEWRNVDHFNCGANRPITFEVVFFENSSDILFNYADTVLDPSCLAFNNGASATVGIQVGFGAGTQFSFDSAALADNTALLWTLAPPAPTPALNPGGVVNAASFAPGPLAPGSIAAAFGSNLASSVGVASAIPLPTTLGGASLVFDSTRPVPKFYASPTQVNLQVPWELAGQSSASLTDSVGQATSGAEMLALAPFSPGLFAINQAGTDQGAVLIANTATFAAPAGSIPGANSQPAMAGVNFLEIYCTGLGAVTNAPLSGKGAAANPLSSTMSTPTVTIGGVDAPVLFSGLAPGFVGLYVVTLQVPAGAPVGDSVPVVLTIGGIPSNTVTIAVQ